MFAQTYILVCCIMSLFFVVYVSIMKKGRFGRAVYVFFALVCIYVQSKEHNMTNLAISRAGTQAPGL